MIRYRKHLMILAAVSLLGVGTIGCDDAQSDAQSISLATRSTTKLWETPYGPGSQIVTEHYRIFTTVQRTRLLNMMPGFYEASFRHYRHLTGLEGRVPEGKMSSYMLADREQWVSLTDHRFGKNSAPSLHLENGGYTVQGKTVCWDIGGMHTLAVASHEGMHQFLYNTLEQKLPLWAEEGLCTTCEGFIVGNGEVRFTPGKNILRLNDLQQAFVGGFWMPIDQLLTTHTMEVAQERGQAQTVGYYGQLYALMLFLRTNDTYRPKLEKMLADAADGRFGDRIPPSYLNLRGRAYQNAISLPIFQAYITRDLEGFEREFQQFARDLVKLH